MNFIKKRYYFSISMNFKDEEDYLEEWIEHHKRIGVEHFYLFDNASTDKSLSLIKKYKDSGIVTLHSSDKKPIKPVSYSYTLKSYADSSQWIAFIDSDEYFNPQIKYDIKEVLQDYEKYPALGVNWKLFGDSGYIQKPIGSTLKNFTKRQDQNKEKFNSCYHIKSIINPKKTLPHFINPHYFLYDPALSFPKIPAAVTENYETIDGKGYEDKSPNGIAFSPRVSYDKISLHHYWCRSKDEYFKKKCSKPRDDNNLDRNDSAIKEYEEYNNKANDIEDASILRHY